MDKMGPENDKEVRYNMSKPEHYKTAPEDKIPFSQKFVYGIKTLIPLAIGLTKYEFLKFTILNFFATIVWTAVIGIGSYMAGNIIIQGYEAVSERPYIAPIVLFALIGGLWLYMSKATKKR
jgi:membrane protein DedA with SNARE-associated domain